MNRRGFVKTSIIMGSVIPLGYCRSVPKMSSFPKVLLIGDSISIGYLPFVQEIMDGVAMVDRIPLKSDGKPENCQGSTYGVANLDRWLGDKKWDVIHFNFGLHDIKHVNPETGKNSNDSEDPPQADLDHYKKNLIEIVTKLKHTGAKLIYATTTPYPEGVKPYRGYGDEIAYNNVAKEIMDSYDIPINDLHDFVLPQMEKLQRPVNVHFTEEGSKALAAHVARSIDKTIKSK